ncbi:MAG: alpha/beta hydrolase [Nannocystis sp.]|nr:alpha/beta hydrolase-fold protein [Nannocystis sp.]MBA3547616.1 alpha/beta hydrolase [Nannocystis sp.]
MTRDRHGSSHSWLGVTLCAGLLQIGCYTGLAAGFDEQGQASSGAHEPSGGDAGEHDPEDESGSSEAGADPEPRELEAGNQAPVIVDPGPQVVDEDSWLVLVVKVRDPDEDPMRVWAQGLPPGARWDEEGRRLSFRPDFIQGGRSWTVTIIADDGQRRSTRSFEIDVDDTIEPPEPEIKEVTQEAGYLRIKLNQITDDYLDSPGHAGRSFDAYVTVPDGISADAPVPVRLSLHGFGSPPAMSGSSSEFRIGPHDPENTYWWGYDPALPEGEPSGEDVPDYSQRRALQLVGWVLDNYAEADRRRVYVLGSSMGGAGAMTVGLWYARHFAYLHSVLGQGIPRNHRPGRITQLEGLWGPSDGRAWDLPDVTRLLADSLDARNQYLFVRHGKDDNTIHFGAALLPSALTDDSLYSALQGLHIGHLAVWDEGGHGPADPLLGSGWWDQSFSLMRDEVSFLRSDLAFPAFTLSSADGDPGDGDGNGKQGWSNNSGFAGDVPVPGDTGWNGAVAGTLNRFLRWDATQIVDTVDRFAMPLRVNDGEGLAPPAPGYPSRGDRFDGELPVVADVTPRRVQAFRLRPGERLRWSFGGDEGEVTVDAEGEVTVPGLELTLEWQTLTLERTR